MIQGAQENVFPLHLSVSFTDTWKGRQGADKVPQVFLNSLLSTHSYHSVYGYTEMSNPNIT